MQTIFQDFNARDLKTATIKDGAGTTLDVMYYRYYTAGEANGFDSALQYAFGADAYARLAAAYADPFAATDAQVAPYADIYFEYNAAKFVTKEVVQGDGACCGGAGGLGTYTFQYFSSTFSEGHNSRKRKTVETLPDGNQHIVYTNFAGQVMLKSFKDTTSSQEWITYSKYDDSGRTILSANPSAVSGYNDTYADLVHDQMGNYEYLRDSQGLIEATTYYTMTTATSSSAGGAAGFLQKIDIKRGETGTAVLQEQVDYFTRSAFGTTFFIPVVRRAHPQPGVDLTYIKQSGEANGDAGDQYTGLDRFGRVVDQRWRKTSDGSHTDRFKYGHDRNGNRLFRENAVAPAFSELYHANGAGYGYDNLDQLQEFRRGTLSDANSDSLADTVTTASRSQAWTLDAAGNWSTLNTDGTGVNRTHNKQNQVTVVGAANLSYDANGNLTQDQNGQQYVFDAWNRMVKVKDASSAVIAAYEFDALGRRIEETASGVTKDIYFSAAWQVLEERIGSDVKTQYVWSPVYVDALVLRDRDADGSAANGLEERLYVQQDANFNVTALINTSGAVVERMVYDPFGTPEFLNASWTTISGSAYSWTILHQGGRYETATGLYHFRHRELHPALGRFIQRDPLSFAAGDMNVYRYVSNSPVGRRDPSGLSEIIREILPDGREVLYYVDEFLGFNLNDTRVWIGILDQETGMVQRGEHKVPLEQVLREGNAWWGGATNWSAFFTANAVDPNADRQTAFAAARLETGQLNEIRNDNARIVGAFKDTLTETTVSVAAGVVDPKNWTTD